VVPATRVRRAIPAAGKAPTPPRRTSTGSRGTDLELDPGASQEDIVIRAELGCHDPHRRRHVLRRPGEPRYRRRCPKSPAGSFASKAPPACARSSSSSLEDATAVDYDVTRRPPSASSRRCRAALGHPRADRRRSQSTAPTRPRSTWACTPGPTHSTARSRSSTLSWPRTT
jgi:hypothetical protein